VSATETNQSLDDLKVVRAQLEKLAAQGRMEELIELVIALLVKARNSNTTLTLRLQNALRMLYGRRSEKVTAEQLALMFEGLDKNEVPDGAREALKDEVPPGNVPPPEHDPKPPTGHKGRKPLPGHLPRKRRVVPVPEAERMCAQCGTEKTGIGYIKSEILDFVPAQFVVIEEEREKLACPACKTGVVAAESEKVIDRGRPGPGLLAKIVVDKFEDAMPIYRQAKETARLGVPISPSTLGDWSATAIDWIMPIAHRTARRIVASYYARTDDTGLRILDRDHPKGVKLGHMWAYVADRLVAFNYTPDWKAEGPAEFLRGFGGFLQGDGYPGYERALRESSDGVLHVVAAERRLGCGMHIRRKFYDLEKAGDQRGAVALAFFRGIYRLEADYKARALSAEARQAERATRSIPLVDELYAWIHTIHDGLVPGNAPFKATQYAINQEAAFRRCFLDGRFEIDNGEVERQLRRVALGRKNYLFAGSDKGAERIAAAYTVLGSCHMNGKNPLAYLTDVITKLSAGWPMSRLDELLPDVWTPAGTLEDG
jgi:transposase